VISDAFHREFEAQSPSASRAGFFTWWFSSLRDYGFSSLAGEYVPLPKVLRPSLERTVKMLGATCPEGGIDRVMAALAQVCANCTSCIHAGTVWRNLCAYPIGYCNVPPAECDTNHAQLSWPSDIVS
jgi:hypothetical protein